MEPITRSSAPGHRELQDPTRDWLNVSHQLRRRQHAAGQVRLICTFIWYIVSPHVIIDETAPSDLLPEFRSALSEAEGRCVALLRRSGLDDVSRYYLSLAAIGMAGHPLGMLVMDHMDPNEEAESAAICVNCRNEFSVAVNEEGIFTSDEVGLPESARQAPLSQGASAPAACRSSNPWKDLVGDLRSFVATFDSSDVRYRCATAGLSAAEDGITRSTSGTAAFGLLGDLMAASRYLHACDQVRCPQCGCEFVFAERWWGMVKPRRSVFDVLDF